MTISKVNSALISEACRDLNVNNRGQIQSAIWQVFKQEMGGDSVKNIAITFLLGVFTLGGYAGYLLYRHHRVTMACKNALEQRKSELFPQLRQRINEISNGFSQKASLTNRTYQTMLKLKRDPSFNAIFTNEEFHLTILSSGLDGSMTNWDGFKAHALRSLEDSFRRESGFLELNSQQLIDLISFVRCLKAPKGKNKEETRVKLERMQSALMKITTHPFFQLLLKNPPPSSTFLRKIFFKAYQNYQESFEKKSYRGLIKTVSIFEKEQGGRSFGKRVIDEAREWPRKTEMLSVGSTQSAALEPIEVLEQVRKDIDRSSSWFTHFISHYKNGSITHRRIERQRNEQTGEENYNEALHPLLKNIRNLFSHRLGFDPHLNQNIQHFWDQTNVYRIIQAAQGVLYENCENEFILDNQYSLDQEFHDYEGEDRIVQKNTFFCRIRDTASSDEEGLPKAVGKMQINYSYEHRKQKDGSWQILGPHFDRPVIHWHEFKPSLKKWSDL